MKKVGRNDACPCGSGKKYKHCCLPLDNASGIIRLLPDPEVVEASRANGERMLTSLLENAPWGTPQYRETAQDLLNRMKDSYETSVIEKALQLWLMYSTREMPQIRKAGVMQAAIEYSIATLYGMPEVTQSHLAEKYEVSPGTISQRAQKILEAAQDAGFAVREAADPSANGEPDQLSVERAMRDLTKQLESNKFETIQEAQAYFQQLLYGKNGGSQEKE
ncbi:SEC-C metal-binding domain-containing protein [Paenibacillus filicis]|uniref:SEC-C metal-binding domain-containing protein n=1 Tax=Paenibacillus gyeongsangnamensis TaxID=3388067 RepID=A0ABT4Q753_9BACL|nr:SEC-C metal-binding domain-containing protein [Paenibacillus filicis]MCZ8512693.1 SEC-C metal-binding domain-containing protein [Paenibacillus filicis]